MKPWEVSTELTDNPGEWKGALSGVLMPTFLAVPAVEPPGALAGVGVVVGVTRASVEAGVRVAGRRQCCGGRGRPWSWRHIPGQRLEGPHMPGSP